MTPEKTSRIEDVRNADEANNYLALGWVLTGQYIVNRGDPGEPHGEPHFILAWQKPEEEPRYPEGCEKLRTKALAFGTASELMTGAETPDHTQVDLGVVYIEAKDV